MLRFKYKKGRGGLYEVPLFIVSLLLILLVDWQNHLPSHSAVLAPPQDLKHFTLGYNEIIADTLWVRLLQDFELCGTKSEVKNHDFEIAKKIDKSAFAKCREGWGYQMTDLITELSPRFKMPYTSGALILGIVAHDNEGAAKIFKKGVDRFPNDWEMAYRAGYHSMAAIGDQELAAKYLIQAAKQGAPGWVYALAAKLQTKIGQAVLAKPVLEEAIEADPNSIWAERLRIRLEEVNKIIEKGE